MPSATQAYLDWAYAREQKGRMGFFKELSSKYAEGVGVGSKYTVNMVDTFRAEKVPIIVLPNDLYLVSAVVRHGAIPCSPIQVNDAFSIDTLELFRVARNCNLHFSIQAFVRMMSDLQGIQFNPYRSRQFTITLDLYLQILRQVKVLVQTALRRNVPNWRLQNSYPSCTYVLEAEPGLKFSLLYTMDGNDSLKRAVKQEGEDEDEDTSTDTPGEEVLPGQSLGCNRYLTCEEVDVYANDHANVDLIHERYDRYIFDETGIFMAVCRHGFSLVITDMVRSGERAKYPLAVVSRLLTAYGRGLGAGYDIRCKFKTTLDCSSLGPRSRSLKHTSLVGSFHGHAHSRLCQLSHLATYVEGLGLEDLEGCEQTFLKSNALASSTWYASAFHRRQTIAGYFEHNDEYEVYQNLSTFLYNNYKQALEKLSEGRKKLPELKRELSISDDLIFHTWLAEERAYLLSRRKEPEEETLQMTYWQKLTDLAQSKVRLRATDGWSVITPATADEHLEGDVRLTTRSEMIRCHAQENYDGNLAVVQELELKLGIRRHWEPDDEEWQRAGRLVANRKYQRALDALESLVVARIFELGKMNQAGTGYKLRKHIGKALQAQSSAIKTALDSYNNAACALSPSHHTLVFEEVIEYAFLADFDLLYEEIKRLNVETRRLVTYLRDEDHYLQACEAQLHTSSPALAHQLKVLQNICARFNAHHLKKLGEIAALPGFSGDLSPGTSLRKQPGSSVGGVSVVIPTLSSSKSSTTLGTTAIADDTPEELDMEEEEDETSEECTRTLEDVLTATMPVLLVISSSCNNLSVLAIFCQGPSA
ncbi:hypothetical protein HYDPIDRAFT_178002 [Hydnomerulius pinastri MD-312]|uniref:Unplaced genomic scaffold scaffold_76, whole genome shotgun sequence n=1 Tax=Hydnomerulius pinastri MD-312 TaxID=994086 RepID=A0A0C9VZA6_9AGAM|nr:hypothetical protein HYDPIDRAFT_178002 [Hydnomerulius pinastri MD-312]